LPIIDQLAIKMAYLQNSDFFDIIIAVEMSIHGRNTVDDNSNVILILFTLFF